MKHLEGVFTSGSGVQIHHQSWLPDGRPKAGVVISHGLAEHSGRYAEVAGSMIERGFSVYGLDYEGHGKSGGPRVYIRRFSDYTATLDVLVQRVRAEQPNLPLLLYGHSVGALIAATFLIDAPFEFSGAVFSGPCVKVPASISSTTVLLARILSRIAPRLGLSSVDSSGISRDPAQVKAYVDDPLVYHGKTTARLGCELLKAMRRIPSEASRITLPVLIVQGGADFIVDPESASLLHDAVGSNDKTLTVYDGLFHEIHNEPERSQVLADVCDWLDRHC